jgi:hypothetical protein
MATTETIGKGLTFEKVWAALMENREQMKATDERMRATDEQMSERMKATNEQMKDANEQMSERMKATDEQLKAVGEYIKAVGEQIKKTDKQLGKLGNRFGEMTEYTVVPNLVAKFKKLGFKFEKTHQNTVIRDQEHGIFTEIDVFLENGDQAMAVEIKTKPDARDIDDHIERMEKLRRYADFHNDMRKYLGAIAGVVFGDSEKTCALKKGFYVIEPSGDTFTIIEPKGEYQPREW